MQTAEGTNYGNSPNKCKYFELWSWVSITKLVAQRESMHLLLSAKYFPLINFEVNVWTITLFTNGNLLKEV